MKRVLVTGGAGAIGSNLCRALMSRNYEVMVLDDFSSGYQSLIPKGAQWIKGSVSEDRDLREAFAFKPDFVFHLAALFANQKSVDQPIQDLMVNGMGTLKIFEESKKNNIQKVVYVSSSCVYGSLPDVREDVQAFDTETPYAITKRLGEKYATFWSQYYQQNIAVLRIFNSYGPGEYPGKYRNVIPNFMWRALQGKSLPITGDGTETRDFTYVEDIVAGMILTLEKPTKAGDIFNLASGKSTRIVDLANAINKIANNSAGIEFFPARDWDGVRNRLGNIGKAVEILGYQPQTSLETGLKRTYNWLKENEKEAATYLL